MKENEAPEKIYLGRKQRPDKEIFYAFTTPVENDDIEYTHTDVIIEKACEYFAPHIKDNSGGYDRARIIENFKRYMEK